MPVYFDKAKGQWRFSFNRIIGNARVRSTKLLPQGWSRNQAEQYDRRESSRLYAEATGIEKPRLMLAPAVALYLDHRCPDLRNGKKVAQDLAHLFPLIESAYLDQLDDIARQYILANPHLSPATIHNRLAYLRAGVRYARRTHGYGKGMPDYAGEMVLPKVDNGRQVYAKLPEIDKLHAAFEDDEARALFALAFGMGLRWRAELLTRTQEHIQVNGDDVWLEIGRTKNGDPVMKPVPPDCRKWLRFIPFQHGDSWFYGHWSKAKAAIGRPDLRPHDQRHSLASHILSTPGGTLADVKAALHQKSYQSAERYAHLYPERAKEVLFSVRKMHTKKTPLTAERKKKVA
jgi:integrase